jgi:hypothetical protein
MMEDHFLLHICLLISTTLVHPFPTLHACSHVFCHACHDPTSSARPKYLGFGLRLLSDRRGLTLPSSLSGLLSARSTEGNHSSKD